MRGSHQTAPKCCALLLDLASSAQAVLYLAEQPKSGLRPAHKGPPNTGLTRQGESVPDRTLRLKVLAGSGAGATVASA